MAIANVKRVLARATDGVGNLINSASQMSSQQIQEIDRKRSAYLAMKPDASGEAEQQLISRLLGAIGIEVYQAYIEQLKSIYTPVDIGIIRKLYNRIAWVEIKQWVSDSSEDDLEKLASVYQVLRTEDCSIALVFNRKKDASQVYIGVVNSGDNDDPSIAQSYMTRLLNALRGNFPGVDVGGVGRGPLNCLAKYSSHLNKSQDDYPSAKHSKNPSIAIISNLASEKSKDFHNQRMEKLLDGIVPEDDSEEYSLILIAKPVNSQLEKKNRLFEISSALTPYASWQTGFSYSTSDISGSTANGGLSLGAGANASASASSPSGSGALPLIKAAGYPEEAGNTPTTGVTTNASGGASAGVNFGVQFSRSSSIAVQVGMNDGVTQSHTNYGIQHTLEIIKEQVRRIEEGSSIGLWDCSTYVISNNPVIANNVAHMYLALTQGTTSFYSNATINLYNGSEQRETESTQAILESISRFIQPLFKLNDDLNDDSWLQYPVLVTPATLMTGKELTRSLNMPKKSVAGLPVFECASFGRNIIETNGHANSKETGFELGAIYHMRKPEKDRKAVIDIEKLKSHTFVTGSTGAGKTNAINQILHKLCLQKPDATIRFLVIEPAKGEYKDIFGGRDDVRVYGTNPRLTPLLRLDPFSFPKGIHVYEHMDRLVEIFNVCWPMYAAMPVVLKDAIERAYTAAGWDLRRSTNPYGRLFPSFADVLEQIDKVMEESQYSADSKGDYKGALSTRLRSLTNGINGIIFCSDELSEKELFQQNVIVDLSRVGSVETKALIMGLLVMKLQEHRMCEEPVNSGLRHVTVLEEAHNLLKRTSTEQTAEGANLIGKSVEMLTNAIAEMRAYGEGFIIADQAPGLLDMAGIRNTNTTIILRLPEFSDRELVGKACGLRDDQIEELTRLEQGVAAVYQNGWIEAVLCKVEKYSYEPKKYSLPVEGRHIPDWKTNLINAIISKDLNVFLEKFDRNVIIRSDMPAALKRTLLDWKESYNPNRVFNDVVDMVFSGKSLINEAEKRKIENAQIPGFLSRRISEFEEGLSEQERLFVSYQLIEAQCRRLPDDRHWRSLLEGGRTLG